MLDLQVAKYIKIISIKVVTDMMIMNVMLVVRKELI